MNDGYFNLPPKCLLFKNHFHLGQRSNVWRYIHQYYHYDHHPTVVGNWHSIDRNVLFRLHRLASRFPSYLLNTLKKLGIVRYRGGRKNGKRIVEDYHHISQPSWTIERCQATDVVVSQRKKKPRTKLEPLLRLRLECVRMISKCVVTETYLKPAQRDAIGNIALFYL